MRVMLFLMFTMVMISACSRPHNEKPTNSESFMKGQFVPLHPAKPQN